MRKRGLANKRGTEKPIEIFVALFIILAVAMVMLKMFKGQITEKSTEMQEMSRQSELEQAVDDAQLECKSACSEAAQADCSLKSKAAFCLRRLDPLDLDGDRSTSGVNSDVLGGLSMCEDAIYCPMFIECMCGEPLDMVACEHVLCQYWNKTGIQTDQATTLLNAKWEIGTCDFEGSDLPWNNTWFPSGLNCSVQ